MQPLRDLDAVITRPRGNLPKVCSVVLAVITTVALVVVSSERFCGWAALAILTTALGSLLHGVCLLLEEMLRHFSTRYRCRKLHMLSACGLLGQTLLVALVAGLVFYLTKHTLPHKNQYWELLFLLPVVYTLFKSLGLVGPSEVEVSDICERRKMNVAHGLAWSFYIGYLQLVLPRLGDAIAKFRATHQSSIGPHQVPLWGRGSKKLLILIPLDTSIPDKLEDEDDNIYFFENLQNNEIDRAGIRGRVYKHSVYRVRDEQGNVYDCAMEYATPLLTLYRMSQERSTGFGEPERRQQVLLFYRTLQDILDQSLECRNCYRLILLNDEHKDDPHFLSKTILKHLEQQEKEEFCLTPHPIQEQEQLFLNSPHGEQMSREPTLMMSLEQPLPLREPTENTEPHFRERHDA